MTTFISPLFKQDKVFYDNPNVVSKHQQQAQLLQGAGWEVEQGVCPSRVSAACNVTLLRYASL